MGVTSTPIQRAPSLAPYLIIDVIKETREPHNITSINAIEENTIYKNSDDDNIAAPEETQDDSITKKQYKRILEMKSREN